MIRDRDKPLVTMKNSYSTFVIACRHGNLCHNVKDLFVKFDHCFLLVSEILTNVTLILFWLQKCLLRISRLNVYELSVALSNTNGNINDCAHVVQNHINNVL